MNVVDSSGWLEYFGQGANAAFFAPPIEDLTRLVVPTISLYEVYRRMALQRGIDYADQAVAAMQQGRVVNLSADLAMAAAHAAAREKLPMADSIILATAQAHGATLWTQDAHFQQVKGVRFKAKK